MIDELTEKVLTTFLNFSPETDDRPEYTQQDTVFGYGYVPSFFVLVLVLVFVIVIGLSFIFSIPETEIICSVYPKSILP